MADQQDHLSSGGSVAKANASADTSKSKGKSSSSSGGSSGYRKRHNSAVQVSVEEKRRRQINSGDQNSQQAPHQKNHNSVENHNKGEGRLRNERRNNGAGLECLSGNTFILYKKCFLTIYCKEMMK